MFDEVERHNYASTQAAQMPKRVSMREQLKQNLAHYEREMNRTKELLELLDANPAIEKFMDLSRS